jgi:hypothetical protein
MTKRKILLYILLGVFVGLFLTACAGVAVGNVPVVGGPAVGSGQYVELSLPAMGFRASEAQRVQEAAAQSLMQGIAPYHHCHLGFDSSDE